VGDGDALYSLPLGFPNVQIFVRTVLILSFMYGMK
jgi:hypothetical protein